MTKPDRDTTIVMSHDFKAPRERVFAAFLDADVLKTIWSSDDYRIVEMKLTPQVGYGWRMSMRDELSGEVFHSQARFVEIIRPSKIQWMTKWEDGPMSQFPEMRVTLEFVDIAEGTRLNLSHEFFPDRTTRDHHAEGWAKGLVNLDTLLGAAGSSA